MTATDATDELTPQQKAAAFLVALGPDTASAILSFLDEDEVESIAQEISRLGRIPPGTLEGVLEEFHNAIISEGTGMSGGIEFARQLMENWQGSRRDEIMQSLLEAAENRPFRFLTDLSPDQVVQFLSEEHPQTIALILTHLPTTFGAQILSLLPSAMQVDIALRVAHMDRTAPEMIERVEEGLRGRLGNIGTADLKGPKDGTDNLAELLNTADRTTEKLILDTLGETDPELAERVRALMFVFEDIVQISDKDLQEVLRTIDTKQLALALKGVSEEVSDAIFRNLSERATETLREEIDFLGPVKVKEVEAAQTAIVAVIRELDEEGRIAMRPGAEGGFIE